MELRRFFDEFDERDWPHAEDGTVRWAMVGLGWWTKEHAVPATESVETCETTVLVTGSPEDERGFADEHDTVAHVLSYDEYRDGDARDAYDAVYVATPNALHLPNVRAAAEFGKDVLCEKPLESSSERARELVDATADVTVAVDYRMHVEPAVRRMRDLIETGFVGDPAHVHGHMSQHLFEIDDDPDQWRLDTDLAGPGTSVTDLGIYPINTARFVLDADPTAVSGVTWSGDDRFADVPDERAAFTLEFPGGILASCSASQNTEETSHFRVTGTAGEIVLEPAFMGQPRKLTITRDGVTSTVEFEQVDQMAEMFRYVADHLLTDTPIAGDGSHGVVDVEVIEAVYRSAARGERVQC